MNNEMKKLEHDILKQLAHEDVLAHVPKDYTNNEYNNLRAASYLLAYENRYYKLYRGIRHRYCEVIDKEIYGDLKRKRRKNGR